MDRRRSPAPGPAGKRLSTARCEKSANGRRHGGARDRRYLIEGDKLASRVAQSKWRTARLTRNRYSWAMTFKDGKVVKPSPPSPRIRRATRSWTCPRGADGVKNAIRGWSRGEPASSSAFGCPIRPGLWAVYQLTARSLSSGRWSFWRGRPARRLYVLPVLLSKRRLNCCLSSGSCCGRRT